MLFQEGLRIQLAEHMLKNGNPIFLFEAKMRERGTNPAPSPPNKTTQLLKG